MFDIEKDYNLKIDELRKLLKSSRRFDQAIELALEIHAVTHTGKVSLSDSPTFCDDLLEGLENEDYLSLIHI